MHVFVKVYVSLPRPGHLLEEITILYYNGPISVAHMVMLIAINNNRYRCAAHSGEPLQLKKEFWNTAMSEASHWMRNMSSLPSEFATGQKE